MQALRAPMPGEPPDTMKRERESIHSGQFMVSHFEAEAQDDEDEVAVPIPEEGDASVVAVKRLAEGDEDVVQAVNNQQQLSIDTSLAKLFQCMSLAYRQKLTTPKWNRFRGIRLKWKDKIRLNNVIWRCWHLQFIRKENTLICQFASPLDVDTHNKPEAVVLEGKYWKRKLAAVTAEYKKWRMFYRNHSCGQTVKDESEMLSDVDLMTWNSQSSENMHMLVDEDYMGLMSDTLFSTITNQPFVFPDSREIARAGLADFIQPSLGPLQPNLDDYMDTFEPLQEFVACKLPTVPEEHNQTTGWSYSDLDLMTSNTNLHLNQVVDQYQQAMGLGHIQMDKPNSRPPPPQPDLYHHAIASVAAVAATVPPPPPPQQQQQQQHTPPSVEQYITTPEPPPPSSYHSTVISKTVKSHKNLSPTHMKLNQAHMQNTMYNKNTYGGGATGGYASQSTGPLVMDDRIQQQLPLVDPQTPQQQQQQQHSPQQRLQQQQQQQQQQRHIQELQQFKLPPEQRQSSGYKFTTQMPNLKFTSQVPHLMHPSHSAHSQYNTIHNFPPKEDKVETRVRGAPRGRQRSRSNTREPIRRPPLISAVSDPSLLSQTNNLLLSQLLTGSPESNAIFTRVPQDPLALTPPLATHVQVKEESSPIPILPQPQSVPATLIITTPIINAVQSTSSTDPLLLNSFSSSNSPILDNSQNISSPTSSQGSLGSPNRDTPHRDQRRQGHIHAEQKRRYNIKNGFDVIHSLIPHLNQNPNAKLSKAAMLQKSADYIRQLRSERNQLNEEMECLRQQIETLNTSISNCQSMLPATGAPVSRRRDTKMQEMFDGYVKKRTMDNWKYWIFSLLFRPLLDSFNNFVSTSSLDDLYRSTLQWIEQHCTLGDLRPVVFNSLKYLSTKTEILTEPEKLPEEARQMALTKETN